MTPAPLLMPTETRCFLCAEHMTHVNAVDITHMDEGALTEILSLYEDIGINWWYQRF